jgi:hypothetical protein
MNTGEPGDQIPLARDKDRQREEWTWGEETLQELEDGRQGTEGTDHRGVGRGFE